VTSDAIPADSGFWAHGRLSPNSLTHFNVQEAQVANGVTVEVYADGIGIWSRPSATLARSVDDARDLMGLVAAAYTVRSGVPLDFTFTGWVEATEASFKGTMMGFIVPRGYKTNLSARSRHRRSVDMRAAVELAAAVFHRGAWRLAVRDVHAAHLAGVIGTDDAFVFAARAIEDLAHAVSTTGKKSYSDLHAHLGTTKPLFVRRTKRLWEARKAVAHGDENDPALVASRPAMARLVELSRKIVREAIANEPSLPTA
jgi:hypothetical protein